MNLSVEQLEAIATELIADFRRTMNVWTEWIPVRKLVRDYLEFTVKYAKLPENMGISGVTVYQDTVCAISAFPTEKHVSLQAGEILLDRRFVASGEHRRRYSREHRLELARACAHQILFRLEKESEQKKILLRYEKGRIYSPRELKAREAESDWQAEWLAYALLMPADGLTNDFISLGGGRKMLSWNGRMSLPDQAMLDDLCRMYRVPKAAMTVRLIQLGLCEKHHSLENRRSLDEIA